MWGEGGVTSVHREAQACLYEPTCANLEHANIEFAERRSFISVLIILELHRDEWICLTTGA